MEAVRRSAQWWWWMRQRVRQVNRRGVKRPCEEVRAGELGDLPVVHAELLRWIPLVRLGLPHTILEREPRQEYSVCSGGVRQVAEQYGNRRRCAGGSDGGPWASQAGDVEEGTEPLLGEGRSRLSSRQLNVRIRRCARFLVELRCARPNRKHLKPALLIRCNKHLLLHRPLAPILPRHFLPFRPCKVLSFHSVLDWSSQAHRFPSNSNIFESRRNR